MVATVPLVLTRVLKGSATLKVNTRSPLRTVRLQATPRLRFQKRAETMSTANDSHKPSDKYDADTKEVSGRDLAFYDVDAKSSLDDSARKLIVNYARVAPENVDKHVDAVVRPPIPLSRPCTSRWMLNE